MQHKTLSLLLAVLMSMTANLASASTEIGDIYYDITSEGAKVTYPNSVEEGKNVYVGNITIPKTVSYEGKTYNVTSIGSFAFAWCHLKTDSL